MVPKSKPQINRERALKLLDKHGVDLNKCKVALIGIEGYYLNTMGKKGKNDIGIYDDAFVWISLDGGFATFNGNVDPSRYKQNIATLDYGVWQYKKGKHGISKPGGGYPAYRQAAGVMVRRYQEKTGTFKTVPLGDTINIHRGATNSTSSAGCQTVPPKQWDAFKAYGDMLIDRAGVKTFPYLKVANDGSIA
jgi:hypothetical protein